MVSYKMKIHLKVEFKKLVTVARLNATNQLRTL